MRLVLRAVHVALASVGLLVVAYLLASVWTVADVAEIVLVAAAVAAIAYATGHRR